MPNQQGEINQRINITSEGIVYHNNPQREMGLCALKTQVFTIGQFWQECQKAEQMQKVPGRRVGSCVPQLTTAIGVRCQSEGGGQHQPDQVQLKESHWCFLYWASFLKAFSPVQKNNIVLDFW